MCQYVEFKSQVIYLRKQWMYKADKNFSHFTICFLMNQPLETESLLQIPPGMCNIIFNASSLQWCANLTNQPFKKMAFFKADVKNVIFAVSMWKLSKLSNQTGYLPV